MGNVRTFPEARKPGEKELKSRSNVLRQGWRFAVLNVKMITMVSKGHH